MKEKIIKEIIRSMAHSLDAKQMSELINTLTIVLEGTEIVATNNALTTDLQNNHKMVNSFLACKRIDGLSKTSEKAYLYTIKNFMDFTNNQPFNKVETNSIRFYLLRLKQRGCSEATCDNNRRNLNAFFQWLENENYILKNPCKRIARIKEPFRIKRFFSELEMEKLRDACVTKREIALIDLLLSTGLRIGEITPIKVTDLHIDENCLYVIGKGNKQRRCYLNVRAKKHLQEYLAEREQWGIKSQYLICRQRGEYDKPLCKEEIGRILKSIGRRCDVEDIHCHGIRAFFATNLSDRGVKPIVIQELIGHESYSTTARFYCNKNPDSAKAAVLMYA